MPSNFKEFGFKELSSADLVVDAVYCGGKAGNKSDDPLAKLLPCGNSGGFRSYGKAAQGGPRMCILYSDLSNPDWPDLLDLETGLFTYYGDNKKPGHALHDTPRGGNRLMLDAFDALHGKCREKIPPFFVFTKGGKGWDRMFRGLAVPGGAAVSAADDLVAIWKSKGGKRFQNYRATFTVLDVPEIKRAWIDDLKAGSFISDNCPPAWRDFVTKGTYSPLRAEPSLLYRKPEEQLPSASDEIKMLDTLVSFFKAHPDGEYAFEPCAAELFRMMDASVTRLEPTRYRVDGGRDAVGNYRIGRPGASIEVEFALEAKCKKPSTSNQSGVKETSRLISHLRHRQFGVFITTSCVGTQAYKEIVDDQHPVVILAGKDLVAILKEKGINTPTAVDEWLTANFSSTT